MRSKAIYYRGDIEGTNSKGRDINGKGRDNRRNSKSKVQLFICISNVLFTDNSINRKSL